LPAKIKTFEEIKSRFDMNPETRFPIAIG